MNVCEFCLRYENQKSLNDDLKAYFLKERMSENFPDQDMIKHLEEVYKGDGLVKEHESEMHLNFIDRIIKNFKRYYEKNNCNPIERTETENSTSILELLSKILSIICNFDKKTMGIYLRHQETIEDLEYILKNILSYTNSSPSQHRIYQNILKLLLVVLMSINDNERK